MQDPCGLGGVGNAGSSGAQRVQRLSQPRSPGREAGDIQRSGGMKGKKKAMRRQALNPVESRSFPILPDSAIKKKKGRHRITQCPNSLSSRKTRDTVRATGPVTQLLPTLAVLKSIFSNKLQENRFSFTFFCCHQQAGENKGHLSKSW